jgi:metacaspase-1
MTPSRIVMLSVGVGDYANPKVNDLKLTTADARDMAAAFTRLARGEALVRLLLDGAATKAGIKDGIDWLALNVAPDDLAIFYYSGHGARYRDPDSDEPDAFDELLCPHDTGVGSGVETFIRDDEMRLWLQAVTGRTRNLALIFDCGHSGSAVPVSGATAREIPRETVEEMLAGYKRPPDKPVGLAGEGPLRGRVLLAAAQDHQSSYELQGMKNGLFTTYLLEGLGGEAQSFYALFNYAAAKVGEGAVKHNLQQTPNLIERAEGDLAFR